MENPLGQDIWERLRDVRASATLRIYQQEWERFWDWCLVRHAGALPAEEETVCSYLSEESEHFSVSSLHRKLAAIACAHKIAGFSMPVYSSAIREVLQGARSTARRLRSRAQLFSEDDIKAMITLLPSSLVGTRDRCLILLGFASSLQRSELTGLDRGDIQEAAPGLIVTTTRQWAGHDRVRRIGISYSADQALCPVQAYQTWIEQSGISSGPLFRWVTRYGQLRDERLSGKTVALVVKRALAASGRDPAMFSAGSLRSGRKEEMVVPLR